MKRRDVAANVDDEERVRPRFVPKYLHRALNVVSILIVHVN